MDQFLSTYKKDYVWPSTRMKHTPGLLSEAESCMCESRSRELKVIDLCGEDQEWSRIAPMGRLLDPKLYPAKTGPAPETEATKFDQPSTYLKKLEEKYPNLYGILQSTPMDEVIKRVDEDRLKTTYQVDFSDAAARHITDTPMGDSASAAQRGQQDCQVPNRGKLKKSSSSDKDKDKKKKKSKKEEEEGHETRLPPWKSEYQDNISKLGDAIMKTKMHERKNPGPAWAMVM